MSIWMADWTELNWIDWLTGQMSKAISPISIVCSVYDFLILVRTQSASQSDDCSLIGNLWRKQIVRSLFHYFWNPIWRITNCPQMGSQYRQTQSETEEGDWDKILMAADDMWLSLYVSINRLQSMTISMGSYKLWESVWGRGSPFWRVNFSVGQRFASFLFQWQIVKNFPNSVLSFIFCASNLHSDVGMRPVAPLFIDRILTQRMFYVCPSARVCTLTVNILKWPRQQFSVFN